MVGKGRKTERASNVRNASILYMKARNKNNTPKLTYRQSRAVEMFTKRLAKSMGHALRLAGYSHAVSNQPHKVFGSPAVIKALEERGCRRIMPNEAPEVETGKLLVSDAPKNDFPQFSPEDLWELKNKLDLLPSLVSPRKPNIPSIPNSTPTEGLVSDAFSLMGMNTSNTSIDKCENFSSM